MLHGVKALEMVQECMRETRNKHSRRSVHAPGAPGSKGLPDTLFNNATFHTHAQKSLTFLELMPQNICKEQTVSWDCSTLWFHVPNLQHS